MINIYITRHGQDEDNKNKILNGRRNKKLTELGIEQAKSLGQKIAETKIAFSKIYCSPLNRAQKTAQIISVEINGPKPIILPNLIEREFGMMAGKPLSGINKTCSPKVLHSGGIDYFLEPKGAETFPQLIKRGSGILKEVQSKNETGNILLVTHGDIGKMIYAAFYDIPWMKTLENFYFGNTDLLLLSKNSSAEKTHVFEV